MVHNTKKTMITQKRKQWSTTPKRENNGPQLRKQWSTTPKRENNGPQHREKTMVHNT